MPTDPHIIQQIPLDRVTQALYAKIFAAMEGVRRKLTEAHTATEAWVAVFAEFQGSLPELDLPAYHGLRSELGSLADAFGRALNAPLSDETHRLALQVVEHDLPRVAAIAAKLNEEDAPKFFAAVSRDRPEMTLAYFETPEVKPRTRIKRSDFDRAVSGILRTRMEELERLVREDTAAWLRSQGVACDEFEIEEEDAPRFVFRHAGDKWIVIFDGSPEFFVNDTLGARYLDWLLHHPNREISALELEQEIAPEKAKARTRETFDDGLDGDTIRSYLRDLDRLRNLRDEAHDSADLGEVNRLDGEIEAIESELKKRGRSRDAGEKARDNVRKAIGAVRKKLAKGDRYQKAFLRHIDDMVRTGYGCEYLQPQGVVWK